jgi:hypothetical protein
MRKLHEVLLNKSYSVLPPESAEEAAESRIAQGSRHSGIVLEPKDKWIARWLGALFAWRDLLDTSPYILTQNIFPSS